MSHIVGYCGVKQTLVLIPAFTHIPQTDLWSQIKSVPSPVTQHRLQISEVTQHESQKPNV